MSFYRNSVFIAKGLCEYTVSGYEKASKNFSDKDLDVDCNGKAYMITGANSGIGKSLAESLATLGGIIHMVCRNPKLAAEAMQEIKEKTGNPNIHVHILDMSQPSAIVSFVKTFAKEHDRLDALINNAGCMVNERLLTHDGLEVNFATNTLGVHMLTTSLLPLLRKRTEHPRVVTVSSAGMLTEKLNVSDLQSEKMSPFNGTRAYAHNKRQQVIMMEKYAAQCPDVLFFSMHPGWSDTPALRSSMPDFYRRMQGRLRSVAQGADTALWLAVSPVAGHQASGEFFQDRRVVPKHLPLARTRASSPERDKFMATLDDWYARFST